jgi:hypothetical protein
MGREYLKVVTRDKQPVSVSAFLDTERARQLTSVNHGELNELDDRPPTHEASVRQRGAVFTAAPSLCAPDASSSGPCAAHMRKGTRT